MACKGCQKNRAASSRVYITCTVCGTDVHLAKKDRKFINEHLVCGQCYKKYIQMKELEKTKVKNNG